MTIAATIGFQTGTIINRTARAGEVLSLPNAKSLALISFELIPLKFLTELADLSKVAARLEKAGLDSVLYDLDPKVKGFNKVFHWVQQLNNRGFTVEQALDAVRNGKTWIDTKSNAIVKILGDARENGTIKVLFVDGKIRTVLKDKLSKKFVPFSVADK